MASEAGNESLWAATAAPPPPAPSLQGEVRADVAVVGGGFTGLSAALHLAEAGSDVVLLEAQDLGFGGSGRNAGLVNAGLWLAPDDVEKRLGAEAGRRLNTMLGAAPDLVFDLIERHGIACEARRGGTLHLAHAPAGLADLERRHKQWARRGAPVTLIGPQEAAAMTGTERYLGALHDRRAGTIQPLGYVHGLAHAAQRAGARLHARTPATELARASGCWRIAVPGGSVLAEAVILATNAYTDDLWPGLKQTVYPLQFFQFATQPLGDNLRRSILPGGQGAWDTQPVMCAFRLDAAGRLIIGSLGGLPARGGFRSVWAKRMLARMFPHLGAQELEHGWAGRIAFTGNHLPRLHYLGPRLVTCIGYNGRGIGPGTVFGKALAEHLLGAPPETLPLPISEPARVPFGGLRSAAIEAVTRIWHFRQSRG